MQHHSAVPPGPQESWENGGGLGWDGMGGLGGGALINIQPQSVSKHKNTLEVQHYLHKQALAGTHGPDDDVTGAPLDPSNNSSLHHPVTHTFTQ